ncbi:REJ domain-containing protein [Baffinella frigidus]|nr:REJ domain-containing protein [Cryptophyta sp. CCMP2293]
MVTPKAQGTTDAGDATLAWAISGSGLTTSSTLLATKAFSPTGASGTSLVINLASALSQASLTPGASYTITLRVVSPTSGSGATATELTLALPPSGGLCSPFPSAGDAYTTEFTQACGSWASEELPLEYSFGIEAGFSFNAATAAWTAPSYATAFSFILADGSYFAAVRISNALGGHTLSNQAPITVSVAAASQNASAADAEESGFLNAKAAFDRMVALGKKSQVLQAAESTVTSLDAARRRALSLPVEPFSPLEPMAAGRTGCCSRSSPPIRKRGRHPRPALPCRPSAVGHWSHLVAGHWSHWVPTGGGVPCWRPHRGTGCGRGGC